MQVLTFLWHDVIPAGRYELSGFQGPDADVYKLDCDEFRRHLMALAGCRERPCADILALPVAPSVRRPVLLTFDDGGASGWEHVAGLIEEHGWRGHFFITTDYIGVPGFLSATQIRELRQRGHVIGSHSCSHPARMSLLTDGELTREWLDSVGVLSDLLGESVRVASVPGGYYSRRVASAAASSGIRILFNSEPVMRPHHVENCLVLGRFSVQQGVSPAWIAAMVAGRRLPRVQRYVFWNAKKLLKSIGGKYWLRIRMSILRRRRR